MSWWSRGEDPEESLPPHDTDSDVSEQKDGGRVKVKWSQEEDDHLKALVQKVGTSDWKLISSFVPTHTEHQCQQRWYKVLDPELVKGPWTKEEDDKVVELVNQYGQRQWALVAKHLKGRLGKQCRERWHNHLNPDVKKSSWTSEEDLVIAKAHGLLGNRWAEIAKLLPGRTDNAVKNHWNSTIRRKMEMGFYSGEVFTAEEMEELLSPADKGSPMQSCSQEDVEHDSANSTNSSLSEKSESGSVDSGSSKPPLCLKEPAEAKAESDASGETTPISWVVDSSGFLSPAGPGLKEVLDMVDGDLDGWCNLAAFDLPEEESSSPERLQFRLEGSALQELSRGHRGELIPISPGGVTPPSILSPGAATPPSILTRRHRRRGDANNSMTPKSTPVKILPFSPSQFLNMWTKQDSHDLENPSLTSTPVCSQKVVVTTPLQRDKTPLTQKENSAFVTPNHKSELCTTPRTPTPFKTAMEKYGALQPLPQTPNLEDDINEVILKDLTAVPSTPPGPRRKTAHRPPMKKVRKSLALDVMDCHVSKRKSMKTEARLGIKEEPMMVSLTSSGFCSKRQQDSILDQGFLLDPSDSAVFPAAVPPLPMSREWETVVCGQTKDQLIMTEKARRYLRSLSTHAPNRALILS